MNYEKDKKRAGNAPNPNLRDRQDKNNSQHSGIKSESKGRNQGKGHPPLLDKEKNQAVNRDPDQHLLPHEDQNDEYNSPDGGGSDSENKHNDTRRKDKPSADMRRPLGTYQENYQTRKAPSKEDLDENFPQEGSNGGRRSQNRNSGNQQEDWRQDDSPTTPKRRPLGSYQENYQSRKPPSKEDLDENFPRE
jgi:hypothetical protein